MQQITCRSQVCLQVLNQEPYSDLSVSISPLIVTEVKKAHIKSRRKIITQYCMSHTYKYMGVVWQFYDMKLKHTKICTNKNILYGIA